MSRQVRKTNTIVTEINVPIELNNEDREYYNKLTKAISDTISTYDMGDDFLQSLDGNIKTTFELIQACTTGTRVINNGVPEFTGKDYYLYSLAAQLGWNKDNDTSIEYYKDIDANYHPLVIEQKAITFYDILRSRNSFLAIYGKKLQELIKYVKYFKNKKVVIFNAGRESCDIAVRLIRDENIKVYPYYSALESIPMMDDEGNPVLYKTGRRKGEHKLAGTMTQKRQALREFRDGRCTTISFGSTLYKDVDVEDIDVIIFTSGAIPKIRNLVKYKKPKAFTINKSEVYIINLYVKSSVDEDKFMQRQYNNNNRMIYVDSFEQFKSLIESRN